MGLALGPRPARLAHRVLGDGREAPRPGRSRSTAPASTSSSRTTRTSSRSRARSGTSSRGSGCTTGCSASPARRCRSRSGTSSTIRDALDDWGRETLLLFFMTAHWRKPIDFSEETLAQARAQVDDASATRFVDGPATPTATGSELVRRAGRRLQHAGRARAPARVARRGAAGVAAARARRLRARLARRAGDAPPEVVELAEQRQAARGGRDFDEADRLRAEIEAAGWEVRDGAGRLPARPAGSDAASRSTGAGRFARRSAAAARCSSSGRRSGRCGRSRGCATAARRVQVKPERELTEAAGTRDHQGVLACVRALPLRGRATSSPRVDAAARLPRPGHRPAQPRRGRAGAPRAPARPASCSRRTARRA